MREKRHRYLTLLLFLTLVSLISLISDKATMGFYQLNALSFSSFSSLPLPAINQTTIIIAVSILLVIIVGLVVIWFLKRKKNKGDEGQEILAQTRIQEQAVEKPFVSNITKQESSAQSVDYRLAQYIRDARTAGLSDEIILGKLREVGWPEETIKQAILVK